GPGQARTTGSLCVAGCIPTVATGQWLPATRHQASMKRSLRLLGVAVAIAAFSYFVVYAYRALNGQDLTQLVEPDVMMAGGVLTIMCTLLIPLTAIAWSWLLKGLGQPVGFS